MQKKTNATIQAATLGRGYTSVASGYAAGAGGWDGFAATELAWTGVGQSGTEETQASAVGVDLAGPPAVLGQAGPAAVMRTWAHPGTYGLWSVATDWTPLGAPAAGDDVVIGTTALSFTGVVLDTAVTPALDSVTIGSTSGEASLDVGANTLVVTGTGGGATDTVTFAQPGGGPINSIKGGAIIANGLILSGAFLAGHGTLAISGSISGNGGLSAQDGTLAVAGTLDAGVYPHRVQLHIAPPSPNTIVNAIKILGTVTDTTYINSIGIRQKLEIGPSGSMTINAGQTVANSGAIQLDGAASRLTVKALAIGDYGSLTGQGIVSTPNLAGVGLYAGTVAAVGGTLEFTQNLAAATGLVFDIGDRARLQFDGTVGSGNTFTFLGAGQASLVLGNDSGFDGTLSNMMVGAGIGVTNFVDVGHHTVTIVSQTGNGTNSGTVSLSDGAVLRLTNLSSTNWFANTIGDGGDGTEVFVSTAPVCFCRGTLILTERGEVLVEELAVGDQVQTLSGAVKPIVWIGGGRDRVTRANKLARPVIVRRGALGASVPARDLYLTHGHSLYLDGVLIPVENLINHRSILWDETTRTVEYYHIELEDHDVLLADGAPAESYYDAGNRALFRNTRPGSKAGKAKPTFAPVLDSGEIVERVWSALLERAGGRIETDTTDDPDLHLVVDGWRLDPMAVKAGIYAFSLPQPPTRTLLLRSRCGVPSLLGVNRCDHWPLGVAINRIVLRHAGIATCFDYDLPQFQHGGCYPQEDGYCWTDGEFELPARFFTLLNGSFTLLVQTRLHTAMRYPVGSRLGPAR